MLARNIRNVIYNYTDAQRKVRSATSNDAWGPQPALMHEIADLTNNAVAYSEIMPIIWKRLNDHGKNWRHVYKSLVLLEHLLKYGNERVVQHCKENIFAIQTLKDFQYVEDQRDQGHNVREKAKQLVALLKDDERLRQERRKAQEGHERFIRQTGGMESNASATYGYATGGPPIRSNSIEGHDPQRGPYGSHSYDFQPTRSTSYNENLRGAPKTDFVIPASQEEEQLQMQIALAESQREAEDEERRRRNDDLKLRIALERSVQENPTDSQLVDFNGNPRLDSHSFDSQPTANSYALPPTTISVTPWDSASNHTSPYAGQSVYQNDPWSHNNENHYSSASNGNDPWRTSNVSSNTTRTWQPVTTTQVQPIPWTDSTVPDQDLHVSVNFSDPWGMGAHTNQTKPNVNPTTTTIDPELSDIFGSNNIVPSTNSNFQPMPYPSSNPWSTPSSATNFPLPAVNSGSVSPPINSLAASGGSLLYPTISSNGNNTSNNSSPLPSASSIARKTPESFLDDNVRNLVNLDYLVPDTKTSTNPFGSNSSRTPPNPFANASKALTLVQLSASNTPINSSGSALPPPLTPSNYNGNSSNNPPFNNNNPFS